MAKRSGSGSLDKELDRLYGLPLDEFTPARNALAQELKRAGDDDASSRVRNLSKPTRAAGAINRAVREDRREARGLLSAADKLAKAQERLLGQGGRKDVAKAVADERASVDRLLALVQKQLGRDGKPTEAMAERARSTLHAVATNPELRDEFQAGRITADHQAVGFGGLSAPAPPAPGRKGPSPRKRDDARRRLKGAERDLDAAERALERAEADRDEAAKRLTAAEAAITAARKDVERAAAAQKRAGEAVEELR
jgi:hypothetical protein